MKRPERMKVKTAVKAIAAFSVFPLAVCMEGITDRFGAGGWASIIIIMLFIYAAATA